VNEPAVRISANRLTAFAESAFCAVGVPAADACTMADALVDADLRGVHSHGARWIPR